jgi:hypothetical protein
MAGRVGRLSPLPAELGRVKSRLKSESPNRFWQRFSTPEQRRDENDVAVAARCRGVFRLAVQGLKVDRTRGRDWFPPGAHVTP